MNTPNHNAYQENGINFYIITYNYFKNGIFEKLQWHCIGNTGDLARADQHLQYILLQHLASDFPGSNYTLEIVPEHSYPIYKELFLELGGTIHGSLDTDKCAS